VGGSNFAQVKGIVASGGFRGGKGGANAPPLVASNVLLRK